MKKILLLTALALGISSMPASAYTVVTDPATQMTDGTIISLQCCAQGNGLDYYFNGAAIKTEPEKFSYSNLYKILAQNGAYVLQRLSDTSYVGHGDGYGDHAFITTALSLEDATPFTFSMGNNNNTVRFQVAGHNQPRYLNTNNVGAIPKYFSGTANLSYWKVTVYTEDEVAALVPTDVTYIFPHPINGETTVSLVTPVANGQDAANFIPESGFFNVSGLEETNTTVSDENKTFHVSGTWDLMDFTTVYRAKFRQTNNSANKNYGKYWLYDAAENTSKSRDDVNHSAFVPERLWYFEYLGLEPNGLVKVAVHNVAAPASQGLTLTTDNTTESVNSGSFSENATVFYMRRNNLTSDADCAYGSFVLQHSGNDHAFLNDIQSHVAIWHPAADKDPLNDAGSTISLYSLVDADWTDTDWHFNTENVTLFETSRQNPSPENIRRLFEYEAASVQLETLKEPKADILVESGLFTEETAAEALAAVTIPETAESFENAVTEADVTAAMWAAIRNRLDGQRVTICSNQRARYLKKGDENNRITTDGELTMDAVWQIDFTGETFTMKNLAQNLYANGLNVAEQPTDYKLVNEAPNYLEYGVFAIQNPAQSDRNYLNNHADADPNIRYFNANSSTPVSYWRFSIVTEEQEQAWIEEIQQKYVQNVDSRPSTYTTGNDAVYLSEKATAEFLTPENLYSDGYPLMIKPAYEFYVNAVNAGILMRIKNHNNTYYSLTTTGASFKSAAEADESTLFYFAPNVDTAHNTNGGHLISLAYGVAACQNADGFHLNSSTSAEQNADLTTNATHVFFDIVPTDEARYYFNFYRQNEQRYIYNAGDSGIDGGSSVTSSVANHLNYTYFVDQVDEITVKLNSSDGAESLVCPVALKVPVNESVTFYSCSTSTNGKGEAELNFEKLAFDDVIAPNTPIIIKFDGAEAVTIPVAYDYEAEPVLFADDNRFGGSYLTLPYESAEGKAVFVKSAEEMPATEEQASEKVNFKRVADGEALPAGAVTVALDDDDTAAQNVYLTLSKSNGVTTGIEEVVMAEREGADVVYDLQGRRLSAPVRGINIINGRKVFVK